MSGDPRRNVAVIAAPDDGGRPRVGVGTPRPGGRDNPTPAPLGGGKRAGRRVSRLAARPMELSSERGQWTAMLSTPCPPLLSPWLLPWLLLPPSPLSWLLTWLLELPPEWQPPSLTRPAWSELTWVDCGV